MEMEIDRLSALPDELLLIILRGLYPYDTKVGAKTATLSKRWRFLWIKLIDRLSALPDNLLVDILRRLGNTKEAARTAVVSKRLRSIWTKLPLLSFSRRDQSEEPGRCYAGIRAALAARRNATSGLEHNNNYYCSLYLSLYYDDAFADDFFALLDFATESRVGDVNLSLMSVVHKICTLHLPRALYSYPSLKKLSLDALKLVRPETSVEWGLMTELSLSVVELPQEAMDQIISGCPLLIRLKVNACSGFNRLDVRGRCFRELYVHDGCGCSELLEISAPCMTSMAVAVKPGRTTLRLTDVSSVEHLRIGIQFNLEYLEKETEMFWNNEQLVQLLQRVTSLVLEFDFFQVLSYMRKKGGHLQQFRAQHLTITDNINTENIVDLLALLESSPFLDRLEIHDSCYWYRNNLRNMDRDPSVGADSICDLLHLKYVEIEVYLDQIFPHEVSFTLAQILLRRAPVLEEMVIRFPGSTQMANNFEYQMVNKFEGLLTYPKSSQKALVHIDYILARL